MIDTGNTIEEESAITAELHRRLNVGLEEVGGIPIGTANKNGPRLQKLGVSNLIEMQISGIRGKFQIKPAVVETLSDQLNLGNGFLESVSSEIPVSIKFNSGKATLQVGAMQTELIRQMTNTEQMGTEQVVQEDPVEGQRSQRGHGHTNEKPTVSTERREGRSEV